MRFGHFARSRRRRASLQAREAGRPLMKAFQAVVSCAVIAALLVAIYVIP
jgi:hypothetical protein